MSSENIYVELTRKFNQGKVRTIITSGQAVVFYRLAMMSKDGDWIIREDEESFNHILSVLAHYNAKYRFGAPLDMKWLKSGWSSHFEFNYSGRRIRTDFFSRPPRIDIRDIDRYFHTSTLSELSVIDKVSLIKTKQTDRLKDYAVIGDLSRELPAFEQLLYSQSARDILAIKQKSPLEFERAKPIRNILQGDLSLESLEENIDRERRGLMRANANRIEKYQNAAQSWALNWQAISKKIDNLSLTAAHAYILQEANKFLPTNI